MQLVKNNFINLVVLVLLVIILLQKCGHHESSSEAPTIVRDTTWVYKDSVINSKPQIIKTIPVNVYHDMQIKEYIPDTSYAQLLKQYQDVVFELLNKNIYLDSLKIDSIGYVKVEDTVSKNFIVGRSYTYSLKYPIIKETITLPAKKRNQVYIGGGLQASTKPTIDQINAGLMFKTKSDFMFGGTLGVNTDGSLRMGVQSFWKIKLK